MGSEMCIRDSRQRVHLRIGVVLAVCQQERRVARALCVKAQDCLLYTSDAADDLLCVDLGGRRIIHKIHHLCLPSDLCHDLIPTHVRHPR